MSDNKDFQRYSRVDLDEDTTLVLSERLLNSLFEHMKDGLNRTEKLVQEMSKVAILNSEKQENLEAIIEDLQKDISSNNQKIIEFLKSNIEVLKIKGDENTRHYTSTKTSLSEIGKDLLAIKDKIFKYFVTISAVNAVIAIVTAIMSWFVFFKD